MTYRTDNQAVEYSSGIPADGHLFGKNGMHRADEIAAPLSVPGTNAKCREVRYIAVLEGEVDMVSLLFREMLGGAMRVKITIAASVILLATANSRAEGNKACILKATATVPRISGLVIKKTRTRAVPAAILATWQRQTRPIIVDVDTAAAGAEETYSYMCVLTKGSAYVRRVMS